MDNGVTSSGLEICEPDEEGLPVNKICKSNEINPSPIRFAVFFTFENRIGWHLVHKFTNRMTPPSPASDSYFISFFVNRTGMRSVNVQDFFNFFSFFSYELFKIYVTDIDSLCLYSEEVNKVSRELESGCFIQKKIALLISQLIR